MKWFLKIKNFLVDSFVQNKYFLQDKHSFKPMLIEIEDRPVNPVGKFILWCIISIFFIGLIWMSLAEIDVVVSTRGKLIPTGDIKTVQATYEGVVDEILVKEGNIVKKGEVLIKTNTNIIDRQISIKTLELNNTYMKIEKYNALIETKDFTYKAYMDKVAYNYERNAFYNEKKLFEKRVNSFEEKIIELQLEIKKLENRYFNKKLELELEQNKLSKLENVKDIIPKVQYLNSQYKIMSLEREQLDYNNELEILLSKLKDVFSQKEGLEHTSQARYYDELTKLTLSKENLMSELDTLQLQKEKYTIKSPVNGYILKVDINTSDAVLTPAQKLLTIVPENVNIYALVDVQNKDIGYLKDQMDAIVKIDTFDFQKFGYIQSKVKKISNSSVEKENIGLVYEIVLDLDKNYLEIANQKVYLKPGMSVTGELKVGKRKVIEFFIYPAIKYFNEGMSVL